MASGGERIRVAVQDFEVSVSDTQERFEAACRLRHQVFCVERGIFEGNAGAVETDRFDARSRHVLLTRRSTGRLVGTVRVVAPSLDGPGADLPMEQACDPALLRMLPRDSTGEISRFAISKEFRDTSCASNALLRLGLLRGVLRVSRGMGLTHWCASMEPTLLRLLRTNCIHFQPFGPMVEHHGLRQPAWCRIGSVLARGKRERPAVWDYVTGGGALWQEQAEASAAAA